MTKQRTPKGGHHPLTAALAAALPPLDPLHDQQVFPALVKQADRLGDVLAKLALTAPTSTLLRAELVARLESFLA